MSSRETTPTITGRFTSPTTSNANIIKKYPGTPKSPLLNNSSTNMGVNRSLPARQRLLSSKISAPRPINLPSLRREHAAGTDISNTASSAPSHGWGSTSNSPSITPESKQAISPEQHPSSIHVDSSKPEISVKKSTDHTSSPVLIPQPSSSTSRVWAVPTTQTTTQTSSNEFPTAAEAASGKNKLSLNDDKEYLKYVASDPNHTSWDEMVSEDLDDFNVDVIEFDDGTKVQVETDPDPVTTSTERPVSPSERFTEDYDRSYPPQKHYHNENYKPTYRRSEDHGYINNRYTHNDGNFDYKRHSSTDGQRQPYPSWPRRNSTDRRTSYDKRSELYPTTLLQRPRRLSDQTFISDRDEQNALQIIPQPSISSTTTNSEEITVAQKTVMLTAAERAKKRRDEQEAEYKAAAERARQKAAALAEQQAKEKSQKEKDAPNEEKLRQEVSKEESPKEDIPKEDNKPSNNVLSPQLPDVSKPWNLVAAKKGPVPEKKMSTSPIISQDSNKKNLDNQEKDTKKNNTEDANDEKDTTTNLYDKNMTEDEKNWEEYVSKVKTDKNSVSSTITSNDWNSFATRLQKVTAEKNAVAASAFRKQIEQEEEQTKKEEAAVEVLDFTQNEEWGVIPDHILHGRAPDRNGWIRNNNEQRGRGRGRVRDTTSTGRGGRGRGRQSSFSVGRSNADHWRQTESTGESNQLASKPIVVLEILKHEQQQPAAAAEEEEEEEEKKLEIVETKEDAMQSKKARLLKLLKESSSPIFPDFIEKQLVTKKPHNVSFMFELDEPEDTNTIATNEEQKDIEGIKDNNNTSIIETNNLLSTPSQQNDLQKSNIRPSYNPNFPNLVYQYPTLSSKRDYHDKDVQPEQCIVGIYLMPQQPYTASKQFMVTCPHTGTSKQTRSKYLPTLSWHYSAEARQHATHDWNTFAKNHDYNKYSHSSNYSRNSNSYRKRGSGTSNHQLWNNRHPSSSRGSRESGYERYTTEHTPSTDTLEKLKDSVIS